MKKLLLILLFFMAVLPVYSGDRPPAPGGGRVHSAGDRERFRTEDISFFMIYCPGGNFPMEEDDSGSGSAEPFWIGQTEVPYDLWRTVWEWAAAEGGYNYVNEGARASRYFNSAVTITDQNPVIEVNWRDTMVFCNALTEWLNVHQGTQYECVYYSDSEYTEPIRRSNNFYIRLDEPGSYDNPFIKQDADGFRLPTNEEWECAARYIDSSDWLPGTHVSGDTSAGCWQDPEGSSTQYEDYAWCGGNAKIATHPVGEKKPNGLGCYDMTGNVAEWVFDWYPDSLSGDAPPYRFIRGGDYRSYPVNLRVGRVSKKMPDSQSSLIGFRLCRNP